MSVMAARESMRLLAFLVLAGLPSLIFCRLLLGFLVGVIAAMKFSPNSLMH